MNIQTVAQNLRNTIASKEKYLAECKDALANGITKTEVHISMFTTHEFLRVNIAELKRILKDVEQCIKETV
jgi:flagellar biosynthesis chaperone FliJ